MLCCAKHGTNIFSFNIYNNSQHRFSYLYFIDEGNRVQENEGMYKSNWDCLLAVIFSQSSLQLLHFTASMKISVFTCKTKTRSYHISPEKPLVPVNIILKKKFYSCSKTHALPKVYLDYFGIA